MHKHVYVFSESRRKRKGGASGERCERGLAIMLPVLHERAEREKGKEKRSRFRGLTLFLNQPVVLRVIPECHS